MRSGQVSSSVPKTCAATASDMEASDMFSLPRRAGAFFPAAPQGLLRELGGESCRVLGDLRLERRAGRGL